MLGYFRVSYERDSRYMSGTVIFLDSLSVHSLFFCVLTRFDKVSEIYCNIEEAKMVVVEDKPTDVERLALKPLFHCIVLLTFFTPQAYTSAFLVGILN